MKNLTHSEMPEGIVRRLSQLHLMGLPALRAKFKELYGFDTSCSKPEVLRRRLAFRVQELHFGGLTEQEEQKLNDSIKNDPVIQGAKQVAQKKKQILHGTRLVRIWRGKKYEVSVCDEGRYEYNGIYFRSLSAVAKAITGTHWNGKTFFGVK